MKIPDLKDKSVFLLSAAATSSAELPTLPPGEEIYDLMPPVSVPFSWLQLFSQVFFWALFLLMMYGLYRWLLVEPKRQRIIPRPDPEKMAARAIERLKISPVWQKRQMKEICESLTAILKSYLFERYEIGLGVAATSDEMMASLVNSEPELRRRACGLFDDCDRVKFMGDQIDSTPEKLLEILTGLIKAEGWKK
ncbi:MAG: hypothetical protein ACOYXC_02650 [Candidatus Rifleibacteriota bacterium]